MSLFVTGTGTEIGKTITCAVLLERHGAKFPLAYWKPVATGLSEGRDRDDVRRLSGDKVEILDECYVYRPPVSPHLAARKARRPIRSEQILATLVQFATEHPERRLVIEGIGGLLVPLTSDGYSVADLARDFHLPALLVASSGLGTINHTLLSLEAMRARKLTIAGVVLNGPRNAENRKAIEKFGDVKVVAELEPIRPLNRTGVRKAAKAFDRRGMLGEYFV